MSSAGASSAIFHAFWEGRFGFYRVYESDTSKLLIALIYQFFNTDDSPWVFESINCSDDFLFDVIFHGGPLSDAVMVNSQLFRSGGPQAAQHSFPLDITVLTDTDDLPF